MSGNSRVAWARIALLFPGPPIDIYGQVLTGVIGVAAGWRSLLIWVALLAAVWVFPLAARLRPDLDAAQVDTAAQRQLELQYEDLHDVVPTPGAARLLAERRAVFNQVSELTNRVKLAARQT